jgi:hypothetical protein
MLRKVFIAILVTFVSAIALIISYPLLGLVGGADIFLWPGFVFSSLLPEFSLSFLESEGGPAEGAFAAFLISFLFWWPIFSSIGCVYVFRSGRAKAGA